MDRGKILLTSFDSCLVNLVLLFQIQGFQSPRIYYGKPQEP